MLKGRIKSPSHNVVPSHNISKDFKELSPNLTLRFIDASPYLDTFLVFAPSSADGDFFRRAGAAPRAWHGMAWFCLVYGLRGESEGGMRGRGHGWRVLAWSILRCLQCTGFGSAIGETIDTGGSLSFCFHDVRPQRMNTLVVILCQFCRRLSVQCMCLPSRLPPKPPNAQDSIFSLLLRRRRRHLRLA